MVQLGSQKLELEKSAWIKQDQGYLRGRVSLPGNLGLRTESSCWGRGSTASTMRAAEARHIDYVCNLASAVVFGK